MAMVNLPAEAVDNPHVGTPLITFYILEGTSFWTGDPSNANSIFRCPEKEQDQNSKPHQNTVDLRES